MHSVIIVSKSTSYIAFHIIECLLSVFHSITNAVKTLPPHWLLFPQFSLCKVCFLFKRSCVECSEEGIKESSSVCHEIRQYNKIYYFFCFFLLCPIRLTFLQRWSSMQQQRNRASTVKETGNKPEAKSFCMKKHDPQYISGEDRGLPTVENKYATNLAKTQTA